MGRNGETKIIQSSQLCPRVDLRLENKEMKPAEPVQMNNDITPTNYVASYLASKV